MFHGHSDYFHKPPLGGRPNTKLGDHGTPDTHNRWSILFYHVWRPAWIEIHRNSIWLKARSHITSHYTWGPVTTVHDVGSVLGRASDTFLLGSHNVMVTALGSRVKWPLLLCESGGEYSGRLKPLTASVAGDEAADCALRPFPSARWQDTSVLSPYQRPQTSSLISSSTQTAPCTVNIVCRSDNGG
jgi:hypothetical protein